MRYNFTTHEEIDTITREYIATVATQNIETIPITEINTFLNELDIFEMSDINIFYGERK